LHPWNGGFRAIGVDELSEICKMGRTVFFHPNVGDIHDWVHKKAMKNREGEVRRECCKVSGPRGPGRLKNAVGPIMLTSKEV
jgi:hypothetical protein